MHSDPLSGLSDGSKPHKKNTGSANIDTVGGSVHAKENWHDRVAYCAVYQWNYGETCATGSFAC